MDTGPVDISLSKLTLAEDDTARLNAFLRVLRFFYEYK